MGVVHAGTFRKWNATSTSCSVYRSTSRPVCASARQNNSHSPGLSSIKRVEGCVTIQYEVTSAGNVPGLKMKRVRIEC